jgi:hypothetical protein
MRSWRVPLALSAWLLLAQLFRLSPLVDVVSGAAPAGVRLTWPVLHIVFAPFTLTADWLNGGSTGDLIGFVAWVLGGFVLLRLAAEGPRRLVREAGLAAVLVAGLGAFVWWGARWSRPIPRLVAADSTLLIYDTHSHTSASHDGRPGFDAAANAAWHGRAGFDAAFITDHNVFGAARAWRDADGRVPRLLNGEELSLAGLHMIVLGNDSLIANAPWGAEFDSSLALLRLIAAGADSLERPYVVASLPEYARNHWGADLGRVIDAGTEGLEIWTTSPKAMDFPPGRRREVVARAHSLGLGLFGATDMHGLGNAASVWNVIPLPGWRDMNDATLTRTLLAVLRRDPRSSRVVAVRRRLAPTRTAQMIGVPLALVTLLRAASPWHALALLGWLWGIALLVSRRRPPRSP